MLLDRSKLIIQKYRRLNKTMWVSVVKLLSAAEERVSSSKG